MKYLLLRTRKNSESRAIPLLPLRSKGGLLVKSERVTLLLAANVFFSFIVVAQEQDIQSGQDKRRLDSKRSLAAMESMPILDKYKGSRFVETRKLQSFSMRALLVCQLTEKI